MEGTVAPATVADHVTPWTTEEEFWNNDLQSLCFSHHGRKSAGERRRNATGGMENVTGRAY